MIVKYIWRTSHYNKYWREYRDRAWMGWFLFGVIPIYIKNTNLTIR